MPTARQIAAEILHDLDGGTHTLDALLERNDPLLRQLQRHDRALAQTLIFGVLRWQNRLDWTLGHLLRQPKKKLDPWVRIVLRMGLFQIDHLDRIPDSAVVHSSVDLVKTNNRRWAAGFVNGVLRNALRRTEPPPLPDIDKDPVAGLSVRYAFPPWLISRWIKRWGKDSTRALCDAVNQIPEITARANTLKTTRANLIESLQDEVKSIATTSHSPEGVRFVSPGRPIDKWPAYQQGWFQVQDEAAQIISHYLDPHPGMHIWDACAGLGTKTGHIAQLIKDQGGLLASDLNSGKLKKLKREMQRLGVSCVTTRRLDLQSPEQVDDLPLFDRILIDAPCSGLGVLQKNPDGKWRITAADIDTCANRQLAILTNAVKRLRPEGILVYAVCSVEPEENEWVVRSFLHKHREFVIHFPEMMSVSGARTLMTSEGFLQTLPRQNQMDGFFAAAFKRRIKP
jgi:16S rRNA (cytosine967-C5)-methyltransferase